MTEECNLSKQDYNHAKRVFAEFRCKNLGDYHDLYLKTDTLLLACVFEAFRDLCLQTYGLDPAFYFTAAHLAEGAFLKTTRTRLELLSDRTQLDMIESMIRGCMASVYFRRYAVVNNKYCKHFNLEDDSTFLFFVDANSPYGSVMQHFCLPVDNFCYSDIPINEVLNTPDDAEFGSLLNAICISRSTYATLMPIFH